MRGRHRLQAMAFHTALAAAVLQLAVRPARAQPDTDLSSMPDGLFTTPPPTTGCPDGFAGVNCHACEEDTYSGGCTEHCNDDTTCSGNGRCRGKDGTCICDEGWTGANCNAYTGVATCPDGFSGIGCQVCDGNIYSWECTEHCNMYTTCSGNGRCRGKDGTCICDEGWTGAGCSIPTSFTTPPPTTGCPDGFAGVNCHAVKRIPTQVGALSNALPSRRAAATGAAEARTGRASATKAGQAPIATLTPEWQHAPTASLA
jgi:hypothetical protein